MSNSKYVQFKIVSLQKLRKVSGTFSSLQQSDRISNINLNTRTTKKHNTTNVKLLREDVKRAESDQSETPHNFADELLEL